MTSKYRFTIDVSGKPRRVLSVNKVKNGDVYLSITPNEDVRTPKLKGLAQDPNEERKIVEDRTTIHSSKDATIPINTINQHTFIEGETKEDHNYPVLETYAIKRPGRYTAVLMRRYQDLSGDLFLSKVDKYNVRLGEYDPVNFGLFTLFYATHPDSPPFEGSGRDFNVKEVILEDMKIGVFWSFHTRGSIVSFTNRLMSKDVNVSNHIIERVREGYNRLELIECFKVLRNEALDELAMFEISTGRLKPSPDTPLIAAFFREGRQSTLEFEDHMTEFFKIHGHLKSEITNSGPLPKRPPKA